MAHDTECHDGECRYAECRGAANTAGQNVIKLFTDVIYEYS